MNTELPPIEAQLSHRVPDNSMLHGSLPQHCNQHDIHAQLCGGHGDVSLPAFCSAPEVSKQLRVC